MVNTNLCKINLKNPAREIFYFIGPLIIFGLCGCGSKYIAGKGFSVMAELYDSSGKQLNNCSIKLLNHEEKVLNGPYNIPGKFHKVFVIPSNMAKYIVEIICPGYKSHQTYVTYGEDVSPITPLRLDEIMMKPLYE